jgi:tight adherence protein B
MELGLAIVSFFFVCAVVLITLGLGLRVLEVQRRKKVAEVLKIAPAETVTHRASGILRDAEEKAAGLGQFIAELQVMKTLDQRIQQAGLTWSASSVALAMCIAALVGILLGLRVTVPVFREFAIVGFAFFLGSLPHLYVSWRRKKRFNAFEEQFPESLDFLARSMRAGHAFSVSLEMMSDDAPEPLGIEFRQVFNEQNLGAPIETALRNLADRVPLLDVRFFVSSVLMQRDTGGNLAEILTKLAYVIRERFRLKGQVKAISAHGRLTAIILSIMPLVTMLALTIVAPGYLASMAEDFHGKLMILFAITGQIFGYWWMRRIIDIKV